MKLAEIMARYHEIQKETERLERERLQLRETLIARCEKRDDGKIAAGEFVATMTEYFQDRMASVEECEAKLGRQVLENLDLVHEREVKQLKVTKVA